MDVMWIGFGSFFGGIIVGMLWREAIDLMFGKDTPMKLARRLDKSRNTLLTYALLASLILTSLVGVGVIINNKANDELIACLTRYNVLNGEARDERALSNSSTLAAELEFIRDDIAYQRGLADVIKKGDSVTLLLGVIGERIETSSRYRDRLKSQKQTRAQNEYPPAELCEGEE